MNDDSLVKVMSTLGLNFNPAEQSIKSFETRIASLNKQLFEMKALALQGAKEINAAFSGQIGQLGGSKVILDQFGQPLKTVQSEAKKAAVTVGDMSSAYTKSTTAAKKHADSVQEVAKKYNILQNEFQRRTSWFLTGTLFYGSINAAKEAVKIISEVEMGVTEIARVMEDATFVFKDYRDELLQLGVDYGQTFETVQDIALRWAQAGYNVRDSLENTRVSLLALNSAELDAKNATESLIGIMAQWGLQSSDLELVLDKINKTADDFTVTSQDLVDGLLRSSGAAKIMGLSLDETIALLTVMREASGRTGREVGNALNSILSYVQRPKSIEMFESLGIQVFADKARTQFRNVMEIFQDVAARWDTLSADIQDGFIKAADDAGLFSEELATAIGVQQEWNDLQQRDISQAAAGVYRRNYFIGMIERLSQAQEVLNNMMDAAGYSQRENARTMETLGAKYRQLQAAAQELAVALGDAGLLDILKGLTEMAKDAADKFADLDPKMKALVTTTLELFAAIKSINAIGGLFGASNVLGAAVAALPGWTKLLAIIPAVAGAIALYAHNAKAAADESLINSSKMLASQLQEKDNVEKLIAKYEDLRAKVSLTENEQQDLKNIVNELAQTYPHLKSAIDDTSGALDYQIEAIKRLNQTQKEALLQQTRINIAKTQAEISQHGSQYKDISDLISKSIEFANRMDKFQDWVETYKTIYGKYPTQADIPADIMKERVSSEEAKSFYERNKKLIDAIMTGEYFERDTRKALDEIILKYSDKANEILQKQIALEENQKLLDRILRGEFDMSDAFQDGGGTTDEDEDKGGSGGGGSKYTNTVNEALRNALRLLEHKKHLNQISLEDEIAYLKNVERLYAHTTEERMDIAERIYDAEQALKDKEQKAKEDRLQNSINWINQEKEFGRLSAEETLAAWQRVLAKQKDYAEAVKEANKGIFDAYKDLLSEQMSEIEKAYNDRMDKIDEEAEKQKKVQQDIIKGIEEQEKALERSETSYSHEQKMSDLYQQLAYWQVRTSEEARQKVLDIQKQIAEEQHDYEIEKQKQSLEDQKQTAQDKIDQIEKEAESQKAALKDMWTDIQDIFNDNNKNLIANAATTSQKVAAEYQKILDKIKEVMTSGQFVTTPEGTIILQGASESKGGAQTATLNTQIKALAEKIVALKYRYDQGDKIAATEAVSIYNQLETLGSKGHDVATMLHSMGYVSAKDYVAKLPQMHSGGETLSYGAVYMKPGELVFPPSLSTDLKALIAALSGGGSNMMQNISNDNRKSVRIDKAVNIEHFHNEDEIDIAILSREIRREITALL